jgi:cytochrome c oxidase assembly protein subunit 11
MNEPQALKAKNRRTLLLLGGLTVGMFGFGFALVPLYGLLCQVTGIQSVEQRSAFGGGDSAPVNASVAEDRWITVKFDGTVHPDLPWRFKPLERKVRVHPGAVTEVNFWAENRSSKTISGQALPSVAPWQANAFFSKMECFCFTQQTLAGGETKEMPLRFIVSPDLPQDISSLTLSYNFMRIDKQQQLAAHQAAD